MNYYCVKVTKTTITTEEGFIVVEAKSPTEAVDLVCAKNDPDMKEVGEASFEYDTKVVSVF